MARSVSESGSVNRRHINHVAVIRTENGRFFVGVNRGGVINEAVSNALAEINARGITNDFGGECAEVNAVARALNHGADLEGASISVSNVRGPNSTSGLCGTFDEPCNVCQALLDMFGIRVVSY